MHTKLTAKGLRLVSQAEWLKKCPRFTDLRWKSVHDLPDIRNHDHSHYTCTQLCSRWKCIWRSTPSITTKMDSWDKRNETCRIPKTRDLIYSRRWKRVWASPISHVLRNWLFPSTKNNELLSILDHLPRTCCEYIAEPCPVSNDQGQDVYKGHFLRDCNFPP